MSWAGNQNLTLRLATSGTDGHIFFPMREVFILKDDRDGTSDGHTTPNAGQETNLIRFDPHPATPAIPHLSS
jgi:hypothetical protein